MVNIPNEKFQNFGAGLDIAHIGNNIYFRINQKSDIGISKSGLSQMIGSTKGNKNSGIDNIIIGFNAYKKIDKVD